MTLKPIFGWALLLALAGCATPQDQAVFVTRTSLGLDVDAAPTTAAFGYNRVEGYLGPRYDNGTVPAVAGSFHTDGGLFNREVRQTYATGQAALNATAAKAADAQEGKEHFHGERKAMFFGTGTVVGVNIGFGDTAANSFTFGFKRKEISVIPVSTTATSSVTQSGSTTEVVHSFPSVFARLDNTTEANAPKDSRLNIQQFFATGVAAQRLANQDDVRREFREEAIDPRLRYRNEEHKQSRLVLNTLHCVAKVPDAEVPKVWSNAEALGVFTDPRMLASLKSAAPQAARALYTGHIRLLQPNEKAVTELLTLHHKYVCDLPGAKA